MRNPLKWLSAIAGALLLGVMLLAPVSAQDEADAFDLDDLSGLQSGVGRYYYYDFSAMMDAMSTPGAEMPDMPPLSGLSVAVLKFDGDDNAEGGFDRLYEELAKSANESLNEDMGDGTPVAPQSVDENDVDDIGDQAKSISATVEDEEEGPTVSYALLARDGDTVILIAASGAADPSQSAQDLAKGMVDRDSGDGDGTFNEDGTSTGGLWDRFPANDDPALGGLLNGGDEILFPFGTPEAGG
jgi:hypothetical protein